MSAKAEETWERMRALLEEVAEIAQSLSEEDMMVVEALMETWMQENPVYFEDVMDAEIVQ